jgi:F-box and WD-40 domain protein CDC4
MANCKIHLFDAATGTFLRTLVGHELGVWCLTLISAGGERKSAPPPKSAEDVDMEAGSNRAHANPFYRAAAASAAPPLGAGHHASSGGGRPVGSGSRSHRRRRSSDTPTTPSLGGPANGGGHEPVVIGGSADSPNGAGHPAPQGLYAGLTDFSANSHPAASSTTSLPPSFDNHFHASASRGGSRPKVAQSDVCGASKGFGQSRTLIVSGGCDRDVRVWDAETG